MTRVSRHVLALGVLLVGCESSDEEPGATVDAAAAAEYCDALVAKNTTCGNPPAAGFCDRYRHCVETALHPDAVPQLTECMRSPGCENNDDSCPEAISAANTSALFSGYKNACAARRTACEGLALDGFFCFETELGVASDAFIQETRACLDRDCAAIRGCMDGVSVRHQCKG